MGAGALAGAAFFNPRIARPQIEMDAHTYDLGNQGALYRVPLDTGQGMRVECTAAVLPRRSFAASIVEQRTRAGALIAVESIGKRTQATVAINGGRFNGVFAPDGLLMVDGKIVGRKRADWIGYLTIDSGGNASVTKTPELRLARYAVQGNVLLVEPGGKMGIQREDDQVFRRTIVAQSGDVIIAMVTTPVSLFRLAYALIERPDAFFVNRIDAALNLSGAATTSFYAKLADGSEITERAYWPNRDVITFTPRASAISYTR